MLSVSHRVRHVSRCSHRYPGLSRWCSTAAEKTPSETESAPRILLTKQDDIAIVTLNRPRKYNALDMGMFDAIVRTVEELRIDRTVRVVLLRGEGKVFSAGLDFKSVASNPLNFGKLLKRPSGSASNLAQDVGYLWRSLPVPVIACLHGMCFGGGFQIALGADFRFATPDCQLSIMEAKWGLIPDMSASVTLRELVSMDVAKELSMTGRVFKSDEAQRLGLVTRVCDDPVQEAMSLAREIVQRSPDSVAGCKALFNKTWVSSEAEALALETELQKKLLAGWNQVAASAAALGGAKVRYIRRKRVWDRYLS